MFGELWWARHCRKCEAISGQDRRTYGKRSGFSARGQPARYFPFARPFADGAEGFARSFAPFGHFSGQLTM